MTRFGLSLGYRKLGLIEDVSGGNRGPAMGNEMRWAAGLAVVLFLLGGCGPSSSSDTLSGRITVAPELRAEVPAKGVLFIIARASAPGGGGPSSGPPLALQRIRDPKFPLTYYLSREDRTGSGEGLSRLSGPVYVQALLDGDREEGHTASVRLEGSYERNPARVGEHKVHIALRRRLEAGVPPWVLEALAQGRTLSGMIRLAPALSEAVPPGAVLFIILRQGAGPPLAVKRISQPRFPLPFSVGEEDQMIPGRPFEGPVEVVARLDRDGRAGPPEPGDLEGRFEGAVIGDREVNILIDKRY